MGKIDFKNMSNSEIEVKLKEMEFEFENKKNKINSMYIELSDLNEEYKVGSEMLKKRLYWGGNEK